MHLFNRDVVKAFIEKKVYLETFFELENKDLYHKGYYID